MRPTRKSSVPLSYYIDKQLAEDLQKLAESWDVPKSHILRASLEIYLKRNLKKINKAAQK